MHLCGFLSVYDVNAPGLGVDLKRFPILNVLVDKYLNARRYVLNEWLLNRAHKRYYGVRFHVTVVRYAYSVVHRGELDAAAGEFVREL